MEENHRARLEALKHFEQVFGQVTLFDACLDVRMSLNGSSDPYTPEEIRRRRDALQARLVCWYEDRDGFDRAVYELVRNTIVLCPDAQRNLIAIKDFTSTTCVVETQKLQLWERDGVVLGWTYLPDTLKSGLVDTAKPISDEKQERWHWYLPLLEMS